MTTISEIHGSVPHNEFVDRGRLGSIVGSNYIPYLSMTKGEVRLALLEEQLKIYAAAFPEMKEYRTAATMISNALNSGVSRGVSFVGNLHAQLLQDVAREISRASRQQRPASKNGLLGRGSIGSGIHSIPVQDRLSACLLSSGGDRFEMQKCEYAARIEGILNDGVIKSGHHMLYKNLKASDNLPSEVSTKKIFQQSGVEGMALVGKLDPSLMYDWVETAILKKNVSGDVGPYSSRHTSFILGRRAGIGEPASIVILAIAKLIAVALSAAATLLIALRKESAYAMAEARGFGTDSISSKEGDWLGGGGTGNDTLLLIGAAAGIYFLTQD